MSSEIAIKVEKLSKCFKVYDRPRDRLLQILPWNSKQRYREFWALKDVTFEIKKGETVGIIGRNGSGKSTLLQMICGTLTPTSGTIQTDGRVAALLELGAGFNPEFTGRENVYMNATILGLTTEEIDFRFDDIAAFADIKEFIDQPVKSYSSGMYVRLAFAVIAHVDADILVIDEALAVGDAFFMQRCMRFLRKFMTKGTVVFVSHDRGAVLNLCQAAIWIDNGKIRSRGIAKKVVDSYLQGATEQEQRNDNIDRSLPSFSNSFNKSVNHEFITETVIIEGEGKIRNDFSHMQITSAFNPDFESYGIGGAEILSVKLTDLLDEPRESIDGGDLIRFHIVAKAHKDIDSTIIGCFIRDRLGQTVAGDTTEAWLDCSTISLPAGVVMDFVFEIKMPYFPSGTYTVSAAIAEGSVLGGHIQHHFFNEALAFECHTSSIRFGLAGIIPERVYWIRKSVLHG